MEVQVDGNESPRGEVRDETVKRFDSVFGCLTPVLHDVVDAVGIHVSSVRALHGVVGGAVNTFGGCWGQGQDRHKPCTIH